MNIKALRHMKFAKDEAKVLGHKIKSRFSMKGREPGGKLQHCIFLIEQFANHHHSRNGVVDKLRSYARYKCRANSNNPLLQSAPACDVLLPVQIRYDVFELNGRRSSFFSLSNDYIFELNLISDLYGHRVKRTHR